jgi:DNA repair exonuclease SbcCD ATPase subunit
MSNIEIIEGNIEELTNLINEMNSEIAEVDKVFIEDKKKLAKQESDLKSESVKIKTLGSAKAKEIQFIEKGVCPTCGAAIDQSQLETKRQEREVLLDKYKSVNEQINEVLEQQRSLVNDYNNAMNPIKAEIEKHKLHIVRLKEQAKRKNVNQEEIDRLQSILDVATKQYDACQADSVSWDRLHSIVSNDVRAKILESFIPALNKNIMKYATELHQPYIVSFDNAFKCTVGLCGYDENIPISSLSTGQLKTVDMMIILGVLGTVIGSSSANVIFLDELFSNLDGGLRNDMCSVLHNFISPDDTMFVISHQDLDERYFNGTIKLHIDYKGQYEKHSSVMMTVNEIE